MANTTKILEKALKLVNLSFEEALYIYNNAPLSELMAVSNEIRYKHNPQKQVTWIIDRNVNISNICVCGCKFCNFFKSKNSSQAFTTSDEEYKEKINELLLLGGNQFLLQGGLNPEMGLKNYENLFRKLKEFEPTLKLHALGPAEIHYISQIEKKDYRYVLTSLMEAGLDSLPGAGAEILVDRVRELVSPNKCTAQQWLDIMRVAHSLGLVTSATMMFGHVETKSERVEHLLKIRDLQNQKSKDEKGFMSFIPWTFQGTNTALAKQHEIKSISNEEYIRLFATARIVINNIQHFQPSWLTVGLKTAQICLFAGADDFGSIMIEEKVISSAGAKFSLDKNKIFQAIEECEFEPKRRTQEFEIIIS